MSDRPPERWIFACDIRSDGPPSAVVARRLLKHLLRRWGIRRKGYSEDKRVYELMVENEKLRQIIDCIAGGVAGQSELLARKAEKGKPS